MKERQQRCSTREIPGGSHEVALKICFFAHLPHLGGAEKTLLELVQQLVEDYRADCSVVVPGHGQLISDLEAAGARVLRTEYAWWCTAEGLSDREMRRRVGLGLANLYRDILPALAELNPDVICTETLVIPYGALAAASLVKPHIWDIREYGEADGLRFMMPFDAVASFMKSHTDLFFGVNRTICGELIPGLAPGDADVLYPAIRVPSSQRPGRRRREGDGFRMCEFAAVNRKRRLDIAIRAAAELVKRGRRIQVMIAGDRDEEHAAELRRLAERLGIGEQVEIRGFLSDVFTAMAECDAVVISAPVHGLGRTAVEGMLLGTPVVYPLGTGFDDVLEDGVTGLGYTAGDHLAMADRIDLLIQDPGLSAELALRAQNDAREIFSRENFSGKFYRKAVELAGRRLSCGNEAYRGFLESMTATVVDHQQHAANLEEILKARDTEISALKRALQEPHP